MLKFLFSFIPLLILMQIVQAMDLCHYVHRRAPDISEKCMKQLRAVCNTDVSWKMFDASSKFLTSGMSYSNVIDYGNFPECMSIKYQGPEGEILGKYCALSVIIVNLLIPAEVQTILESHGVNTTEGGPRVVSMDTFSRIEKQVKDEQISFVISKYSSCVPDACTPQEVGYFFLFGHLDELSLIVYPGIVDCETANSNTDLMAGDIAVIALFGAVVVLMVASTFYDALCQNFRAKPLHPLLLSFSILYNGKRLIQISTNRTEQIQCFNGMRFISMMWVLAYHGITVYQVGALPLENFPEVEMWNNDLSNRYILSGLLAVDTFFYISGFLLAFSYIKSSMNESVLRQVGKVPIMYIHRYLRITPSPAVMFLVTITIFRLLGSGPLWSFLTSFIAESCKDKWWKFFLYVQNYTDPDDMCINPMWYLSADMQMFILAPLVLIPVALFIKKRFKLVFWGLVVLTLLAIGIPMIVRYWGDPDAEKYQDAGNIYTAHERFTNFLMGITFGATMRMYKHKPFIFSALGNVLMWIVVLVVSIAFNLYWFDVLAYYNLEKYTLFMGLFRPVWCLSLTFMVYSCYHNQGGIVQWILERPVFQVLGRLTFNMYVLHVLVELYAGMTLKTSVYFSNYFVFYHWCGHIVVTMLLSVFWVLAFEFPMLTIDKYLLGSLEMYIFGEEKKKTKE